LSVLERYRVNARDQDRLRTVCAEVVGIEPDELTLDTDFEADLNIDRDDLADLFVALEDAFDISLEDGIRRVRTLEDLEALVEDLLPA
jgi:acyl carrier protein